MIENKPIYNDGAEKLKNTFLSLIDRHNMLCNIEKFFMENKTAKKYFDEAQDEILYSGGNLQSDIFVVAVKKMVRAINDVQGDPKKKDISELLLKIHSLESENVALKGKLNIINNAINK